MRILLLLSVLSLPSLSLAQKLPNNLTCQDLIDVSNRRLSRSTDGGRTYVPINRPQPTDAFGQALLSHDTYLCSRLSRGEITVGEFNALHDEKELQLRVERAKVLADRQKLLNDQKALENQQNAVQVQRQTAVIQALQAEAARQQQEAQHQDWMRQQAIQQQQQERQHRQLMQQQQIQQQQLEQIRQEQARPKSFSCFGGGNFIQCN
jgi:hypothetical protein